MLYTCQNCGGWFDASQLYDKNGKRNPVIKCKYCSTINEFTDIQTSHLANGYDFLAVGDFGQAASQFTFALRDDDPTKTKNRGRYIDAYLGLALAQFEAQVVFPDEIADKSKDPEITCFSCNRAYFMENKNYIEALNLAGQIRHKSDRIKEEKRIRHFAEYIDGIKDLFDEMREENRKYQVFLAFEDQSRDTKSGLTAAMNVEKDLHIDLKEIFSPNPDTYTNDPLRYEAEILYAIYNSACMMVMVDDDMDARLVDMYTRYHLCHKRPNGRCDTLGFVRFQSTYNIYIKNERVENNIFDIRDMDGINAFCCAANRIRYTRKCPHRNTEMVPEIPATPTSDGYTAGVRCLDCQEFISGHERISFSGGFGENTGAAPVMTETHQVIFGTFPQRQERSNVIEKHFKELGTPSAEDSNGWIPLLYEKGTETPNTWYRDDVINHQKYRAVYFDAFRPILAFQDAGAPPRLQKGNQFFCRKIYVFKFEPIVWNILSFDEGGTGVAVLLSSMGLMSMPFNDTELSPLWEISSVRQWLNGDFLETAFTESQRRSLFTHDYDSVFLVEKTTDLRNPEVCKVLSNCNISGSDYMKCLGGGCHLDVSAFWVRADNEYDPFEEVPKTSVMVPRNKCNLSRRFPDDTTVAVVPKITLRLQ